MGIKAFIFAVVLCSMLAGCSTQRPNGNLTIRDAAGNVIASGDLWLPDPLPPSGKFNGKCKLKWSTTPFPTHSVTSGKYSAEVDGGEISIDLNPGWNDNNVVLSGSISNGSLSGKWYHATFSGGEEMGRFTAAQYNTDTALPEDKADRRPR